MLTARHVLDIAQRVVPAARSPATVIVFGSYGRGDATKDSDLDLLVIEAEVPDHTAEYLRLREATRGVVFRRSHDLLLLESLALAAGLTLPVSHDLLARLGPYAVEFRYLGAALVPAVSLVEAADAADALRDWAAAVVLTAG